MSTNEELIAEARKWHKRSDIGAYCRDCGGTWPCNTARLADALSATLPRESETHQHCENCMHTGESHCCDCGQPLTPPQNGAANV